MSVLDLETTKDTLQITQSQSRMQRRLSPSMFPEGSDFGDTGALESIWTDQKGFEKASQRLVDASGELVTVSQSGDMKAIGKAVGAVGGACKNCHDNYRASN